MDILLAGGSGFIGRALARAFLARGDRVAVWSRDPLRARARLPAATALATPGCFPFPPEAVVNLAGAPVGPRRWTRRVKAAIRESRVEGTRRQVRTLSTLPHPPRLLLSASAVGFYGGLSREPADEAGGPGPGFLAEVSAAWEEQALAMDGARTRVLLARIGLVLGREGGALPRLALPFRLFLGGVPGDGAQPVSWVHLEDLVRLLLFALETEGLESPFNATAPEPATMAELCHALGRVLRRPSRLRLPGALLRLALGEGACLLLEGRRCPPVRALRAGFAFLFPKLEPALADLLGRRRSAGTDAAGS